MEKDFIEECAERREKEYARNRELCANYGEGCIFPWCDYCSFWYDRKGNGKCDTRT